MVNCFKIGHLLSSSLWITVLIVRVGCLIEAHASTIEVGAGVDDAVGKDNNNKDEDLMVSSATFALSRQARLRKKSLASLSSSTSRRLYSSKNLINGNTATTASASMISLLPEMEHRDDNTDDDSCTGKADGYFPNYGSDCTSYYFCAAGYQITYVCPPDFRFNEKSKKCEEDAVCLSKGHRNVCGNVPNGYYTNDVNSGKYHYCYNNAKVIELTCDYGKVFNGNKCIFPITPNTKSNLAEKSEEDLEDVSCTHKSNGFYPIIDSGCSKYYFCIDNVKTELQCETGLIFNNDVCVHPTRYKCPSPLSPSNSSGNSINDPETKSYEPNFDNFETTSLPTTTVF